MNKHYHHSHHIMIPTSYLPSSVNLTGKTCVVTGGNAGIGGGITRTLAQAGASRIYILSRRIKSADRLINEFSKSDLRVIQLDLSSFASVRSCASKLLATGDLIDLLFLNAGIAVTAPALTTEGFESHFDVNHMGHALLTQLLLPNLIKAMQSGRDVRVVANSSAAADMFLPPGGLQLHGMREMSKFPPIRLYGNSKLANVLFMKKLARLYPEILWTSIHPGAVRSGIWDKFESTWWRMLFVPILWAQGVSNEQGAWSLIWCATEERKRVKGEKQEAKGRDASGGLVANGGFYFPVGKLQKRPESDERNMEVLWEWTTKQLAEYGANGWPQS